MKLQLINKDELNYISSLWSELNAIHFKDSTNFKEYYQAFSFQDRIKVFQPLNDNDLRIECIIDDLGIYQGYCISSIRNDIGEIDSLFINSELRDQGFGKELVNNTIRWLKERACSKILVCVADGHETVFSFYEKFGFYPKMITLELK